MSQPIKGIKGRFAFHSHNVPSCLVPTALPHVTNRISLQLESPRHLTISLAARSPGPPPINHAKRFVTASPPIHNVPSAQTIATTSPLDAKEIGSLQAPVSHGCG